MQAGTEGSFLQLSTTDGNQLHLGSSQYLPVAASREGPPALAPAASVRVGQFLWVADPANELVLMPSEVTATAWATAPGRILPVTLRGGLLVDAAQVSGGACGPAAAAGGAPSTLKSVVVAWGSAASEGLLAS